MARTPGKVMPSGRRSRQSKRRQTEATPQRAEPQLSRQAARAQQRQRQKARKALLQYLSATLAASGFVGLLLGLLGGAKLGVAVMLALVCLFLAFKYPRQALIGFIVYVPFSGTVTYALGGSGILQLAKDAIYLPALLGVGLFCLKTRQPLIIPPAIKFPLAILLTSCTLTMLVVNGGQQLSASGGDIPILIGVLGLKVLLGYLPVITCIFYLLRDREDVYLLLRIQVAVILICCCLGFIQYMMLKTGMCPGTIGTGEELFKASLQARCFVGGSLLYSPAVGQIRLPGTLNAPWQWGWFLISSGFFAFGTAFNDRSLFWRLIGLLSLAAVGIMATISGQRIALALVPLTIVVLLVLTGQIANLKRFLPVGVGLAVILGILMAQNVEVVNERWGSFQTRWSASPPHEFILQQFAWAQQQQEGILGRGVGRATNAARIFGQTELVETYHPKLLYELGPIGLLATLALYLTLTFAVFRAYRSIQDPNLRGYGAAMWIFVLFISIFPYYYPLDVDPVNVYYWLAAGIVLKLPEIDRRERFQQYLQEVSQCRELTKRELKQLKKQEQVAVFE
jgi:hypothetical protein